MKKFLTIFGETFAAVLAVFTAATIVDGGSKAITNFRLKLKSKKEQRA